MAAFIMSLPYGCIVRDVDLDGTIHYNLEGYEIFPVLLLIIGVILMVFSILL